VVAAYTDLAHGKVYNWCTLPAVFIGLLLAYIIGGLNEEGKVGLLQSGLGLLLGGGIFGLFFLLGAFGAADVKLAAAVGALKGWYFTLGAIVYSALVGGILALGLLIWKGQVRRGLRDTLVALVRPRRSQKILGADSPAGLTVPYGFAISIGTMWAWFRLTVEVF